MQSRDFIDLTRQDFAGVWLLFICFAIVSLTKIKRGELIGGGFPKAARAVFSRALIGVVVAIPFVLVLEIWQRRPSHQYFLRLQVEPDRVVLSYRWPKPGLVIPGRDIEKVDWIHERSGRYGTHRIKITTTTETLKSFGTSSMNNEEQRVFEKLKASADKNLKALQPTETNAPSAPLPLESTR
jgi:hypothetical protein